MAEEEEKIVIHEDYEAPGQSGTVRRRKRPSGSSRRRHGSRGSRRGDQPDRKPLWMGIGFGVAGVLLGVLGTLIFTELFAPPPQPVAEIKVKEEIVPPSAEQLERFEAGLDALQENEMRTAILNLEGLIAEDAPIYGLHAVASRAALEDGDYQRSSELAEIAIEKGQEPALALGIQAIADFRRRMRTGSFVDTNEAALLKLREAIALNPLEPELYFYLSDIHRQAGQSSSGLEAVSKGRRREVALDTLLVLASKERLAALQAEALDQTIRDALLNSPPREIPRVDLPAAIYLALEAQQLERAAALLTDLEAELRPTELRKLLSDPVFSAYADSPPLEPLLDRLQGGDSQTSARLPGTN